MEECPYNIKEIHKKPILSQEESLILQRENNEASSKMDERSKEYGDWLVVTRRKLMSKAKTSHQTQTTSQESEASHGHIGKRDPRMDEQSKKDGKRKVPSPPTSRS